MGHVHTTQQYKHDLLNHTLRSEIMIQQREIIVHMQHPLNKLKTNSINMRTKNQNDNK